MIIKKDQQAVCEKCGRNLPVVAKKVDGEAVFTVKCRYCKHITTVKIMRDVEE